jgi:hypothetical protein
MKGKPTVVGRDRVSIRVQLSRKDYEALCKIAEEDRTDLSSLVRRAAVRFYLVNGGTKKRSRRLKDGQH